MLKNIRVSLTIIPVLLTLAACWSPLPNTYGYEFRLESENQESRSLTTFAPHEEQTAEVAFTAKECQSNELERECEEHYEEDYFELDFDGNSVRPNSNVQHCPHEQNCEDLMKMGGDDYSWFDFKGPATPCHNRCENLKSCQCEYRLNGTCLTRQECDDHLCPSEDRLLSLPCGDCDVKHCVEAVSGVKSRVCVEPPADASCPYMCVCKQGLFAFDNKCYTKDHCSKLVCGAAHEKLHFCEEKKCEVDCDGHEKCVECSGYRYMHDEHIYMSDPMSSIFCGCKEGYRRDNTTENCVPFVDGKCQGSNRTKEIEAELSNVTSSIDRDNAATVKNKITVAHETSLKKDYEQSMSEKMTSAETTTGSKHTSIETISTNKQPNTGSKRETDGKQLKNTEFKSTLELLLTTKRFKASTQQAKTTKKELKIIEGIDSDSDSFMAFSAQMSFESSSESHDDVSSEDCDEETEMSDETSSADEYACCDEESEMSDETSSACCDN